MSDRTRSTPANEANEALVKDWLDIVANDSENLERTMKWISDDCIWVMEPGGTEYRGSREIRAFVRIAMSGRTHDKGQHRIEVTNWFADSENLCYEYTHGLILTGKFTAGIKGEVKTGALRYCITCHLRDGEVDRVHEYIDSPSWWLHSLLPIVLAHLHRLTKEELIKAQTFRPLEIAIVAILMVLFGLAEIVTGFRHSFFGISTSPGSISSYAAAGAGTLYALAGFLIWSMKKKSAAIALGCLTVVVAGRVTLIATGTFPINTFEQVFAIVAGTSIVIIFAIYIGLKWTQFN